MTNHINPTLTFAEWSNGMIAVSPDIPGIPTDMGTGEDRYDISVQATPDRHEWYGTGYDVTITLKSERWAGTALSRRYYGIELSDAISDILEQADAFRLNGM
jgi:hypothetical protein